MTTARERIGSFRLVHLIRTGQVCEIWEVEPATGGERAAMKLVPAGAHHHRTHIAELKHEYSVGRRIEHENVIRTFQFQSTDKGSYLLLELFRHPNLKQWLHQDFATIEPHREKIIRGAASGLRALHEAGWIHRDVKPDNFLVSPEGDIKLIDFNLARRRVSLLGRVLSRRSPVQGTRSYMSPEQVRGQVTDERSDVYSFGCLVHEILTGKPPFTGTSTQDLLTKHLRTPAPSVTAQNDKVTRDFAQLVQRMLAKDPGQRPSSMAEFLDAMRQTPLFVEPPRRRPRG